MTDKEKILDERLSTNEYVTYNEIAAGFVTDKSNKGITMKKLKSSYRQLLMTLNEKMKDAVTVKFCFQYGRNYPISAKNKGLLVIGRCTNGWHSYSNDIKVLFNKKSNQCIFKEDAIRFLYEMKKTKYNPNLSAFWRVTKSLAENLYGKSWFDMIAWTNLYKFAPEKGNCNARLGGLQYKFVVDILRAEIDILSPQIIIFFTGDESKDWITDDFIRAAIDSDNLPSFQIKKWNKYFLSWAELNGRTIIVTQHPQGKKEDPHWKALRECITNLK